jgi:hypothetical protein
MGFESARRSLCRHRGRSLTEVTLTNGHKSTTGLLQFIVSQLAIERWKPVSLSLWASRVELVRD